MIETPSQDLTVAVMGLGYIGLPTAAILAGDTCAVLGIDIDTQRIETLLTQPFQSPEPGLAALVNNALQNQWFSPQTHIAEADVFIIAVPTPVTEDKQADLTYVWAAVNSLRPVLKPGNLIIVESTIPPGTTRQLHTALADTGALFAHCPERVLPGQIVHELVNNHRVVGGTTPEATEKACQLYRRFVKGPIHPTTAETAELVKVMENTYRDVNIALANELALIAERVGVNAREVIALANQHPRVNLHQPGPGVGGHCIAVDPWFLATAFPDITPLIYTARRRNDAMPGHVVKRIAEMVETIPNPRIALLGLTYKADVADTREAPVSMVIQQLQAVLPNASLAVFDPMINSECSFKLPDYYPKRSTSLDHAIEGCDVVVIMVAHTAFNTLLHPQTVGRAMRHKQILDTQGILNTQAWQDQGFAVAVLGLGHAALEQTVLV